MKVLTWLAAIISVPLIAAGGFYVRNMIVGPEGWAQDNTIERLKQKMKDSESTIIRTSYVVRKTDPTSGNVSIVICGVVDAKNSFGAYTGGSRFVSRSVSYKKLDAFDTEDVIVEDATESKLAESVHMLSTFDKVDWNPNCVDEQHPAVEPTT